MVPLIDVTHLPIDQLLGDDALSVAVREAAASVDGEVLAAFDNYAGEPGPPDGAGPLIAGT